MNLTPNPLSLIPVLIISCFAGDLVTDSFYIESNKIVPNEAWLHWFYNPQKHDYDGNAKPEGYTFNKNIGYRTGACAIEDIVPATVIMGCRKGDKIEYTQSNACQSVMNLPELKIFLNSISNLCGAYYDGGKIFIVGEKKTNDISRSSYFLPEDAIVAIEAVCNSNHQGTFAALDPADDPDDKSKYIIVRFGGKVENTHIGQVLFECDRLLKTLSIGADNITKRMLALDNSWHKTKFDFRDFSETDKPEEWHTFWFVVEDMEIFTDGNAGALVFEKDKITAKTQKVKIVKGKYEPYFEKTPSSSSGKFTEHFNQNFENYRNGFPVLNELVGIAKLTAVIKWLYGLGIIIQFDENKIKCFYNRYTPTKTPLIKVTKIRTIKKVSFGGMEITEKTLASIGGIDLQNFRFREKDLSQFREKIKKDSRYVIFRLL